MATCSVALITRIFAQVIAEPNLLELCRAQPKISNTMIGLVKIRATEQVAIYFIGYDSCKFV